MRLLPLAGRGNSRISGKRQFGFIEREMNDEENYLMRKVRSGVWL